MSPEIIELNNKNKNITWKKIFNLFDVSSMLETAFNDKIKIKFKAIVLNKNFW